MSQFLCPLDVRYVPPWEYLNDGQWTPNDGTPRWELTAPFQYYSSLLKRAVEVPLGFRFDGPSVPTLPLVYAQFGGRYMRPAAIHDYLCRMGWFKRNRIDRVFLEAMRLENHLEIETMRKCQMGEGEIAERAAELEGRAQMMFAAVVMYSASGAWKRKDAETEPVG